MDKDFYVPLHRHSMYSWLDGYGTTAQIAARLKEINQPCCAITDHGHTYGWPDFYMTMKKNGIKPILGCELYHVENRTAKGKPSGDKKKGVRVSENYSHLTVLAKDQIGLKNLIKVVETGYSEGYYYRPRIDWETIVPRQEGLVVLSGCVQGVIPKLICEGQDEAAYDWANWLKERIEHFYIEIVPSPGLDLSHQSCRVLWKIAEDLNIPTVITDDAHFPRPEDHDAEDSMVYIQTYESVVKADGKRKMQLAPYYYHCTGAEVLERAQKVLPLVPREELEKAARRTGEIASLCNAELSRCSGPKYHPVPQGKSEYDLLVDWVGEGKNYRRGLGVLPPLNSPQWEEYEKRAEYELGIVKHHHFSGYFLLVADIVRWCKANKILCIARGSCGGSLLCYYLGISQVDPIYHELPVERFIDITRSDMPDVDLDVDAEYREKIFDYLKGKYGEEHCAQIAALSTFRARQAVRDIAKVYNIPEIVTSAVLKHLPELDNEAGIKSHGQLDRLFDEIEAIQPLLKEWPQLRLAAKLEGQIRQASVHAAAMVVDQSPLSDVVAVCAQPGKAKVIACDMAFASKMGLLKIDILASETLSAINQTLQAIGKDHDWLFSLPLDDKKTYELLSSGRNQGIFQYKGSAAGRLLVELQPDNFNDLVALAALARPGPLESGGAKEYIERRHGRIPTPSLHPKIDRILGPTYQTILYQEQVMSIMRDVGLMEWPDVHDVRKLVSKSGGPQQMEKYRPQYIEGAAAEGVGVETADHVWVQCQRAGNYIFNKAHGCAYAKIGFWTAFLKSNFPDQFVCTFSKHENKEIYRNQLLREYKQQGGKLVLIDPNQSKASFSSPKPGVIVGGFANLRGCGEVMGRKLEAGQPYRDWNHFLKACPVAVARALQQAGVHKGKVDLDVALTLAPWYISVEYLPIEKAAFQQRGCETITSLLARMETGEGLQQANLVGRVTGAELSVSKHRKPGEPALERLLLTLTDETGSIDIWYSGKRWKDIREGYNPLRGASSGLGNSVYVRASISDDRTRLWGDFLFCFRESGGGKMAKPKVKQPTLEFE